MWALVVAHFAFLVYLPSGGFLALKWPRTIFVHVPVVLWGAGSVALHFWCPLTAAERWARSRAGMAPLNSAGFIEHYVTGTLYPASSGGYVQAVAFLAVLVSWILYAARRHRSRSGPVSSEWESVAGGAQSAV